MAYLFIGIDTGGTFTDLVIFQEGNLSVHIIIASPSGGGWGQEEDCNV